MSLRRLLNQRHTTDIVLRLGDTERQNIQPKMSDVILHSENGGRARQIRLHELIEAGVISEVLEFKHYRNVKHIQLTPLGWAVYSALSGCIALSEANQ